MNLKKTKFMSISSNNTTQPNITPFMQISDDTNIEQVSQFKYLGSILRSNNSVDAEVESRINRAAQVFRSIKKKKVSTEIKLQIRHQLIFSFISNLVLCDQSLPDKDASNKTERICTRVCLHDICFLFIFFLVCVTYVFLLLRLLMYPE